MTKGECERVLRRFHYSAPDKYQTTTFDIEQGPERFAQWVKEARNFVTHRKETTFDWAPHLEAAADAVLAHRERFYRRYLFVKTDEMPMFGNSLEAMRALEIRWKTPTGEDVEPDDLWRLLAECFEQAATP